MRAGTSLLPSRILLHLTRSVGTAVFDTFLVISDKESVDQCQWQLSQFADERYKVPVQLQEAQLLLGDRATRKHAKDS